MQLEEEENAKIVVLDLRRSKHIEVSPLIVKKMELENNFKRENFKWSC